MNKKSFLNVSKHYAARSHEKMQEVLMDKDAAGPIIHYYMIRGDMKNGRGNNITVWEPGIVGREYIKTYGHYHVGKLDETYTFIAGEGIALLQKLAVSEARDMIANIVEEFKAIPVKVGDKLFIPASYGHLVVNTGSGFLVTADDSPVNFEDVDPASLPGHADYGMVKQMRGFAFYVVEENGKPALVKNKRYLEIRKTEFSGLSVIGI